MRVSLADKLHNARSIARDYKQLGEQLWERIADEIELILHGWRSTSG